MRGSLHRYQAVRLDRLLTRIRKNVVDEILDLSLKVSFDQKIDRPDQCVFSRGD